jgi:3-oxoacyl-[acyl-carrier protein] reductase
MGDGGRIINVSSTAARQGNPGATVYSATKAAVESITRVMGVELRDKGIRVNAVNPGPVETDMFFDMPNETQDYFKSTQPVAKADDIADVITFLAGPNSRWINATTVGTNNGVILN